MSDEPSKAAGVAWATISFGRYTAVVAEVPPWWYWSTFDDFGDPLEGGRETSFNLAMDLAIRAGEVNT